MNLFSSFDNCRNDYHTILVNRPPRGREPTMKKRRFQLVDVPISRLANGDSCNLYVLCTSTELARRVRLIHQWGFQYIGLLVCINQDAAGEPIAFSKGKYFANGSTYLVCGSLGSHRSLSEVHEFPAVKIHAVIEQLSRGPFLELFTSHPADGWDGWTFGIDSVKRGSRSPRIPDIARSRGRKDS